jgi:hypothetical protein
VRLAELSDDWIGHPLYPAMSVPMKTELPFLVQWSEGPVDNRLTWWIKAFQNRYFGEVTDGVRRFQMNVEGSFEDGDLATVQQLIQDIQHCSQVETVSQTDGYALLALGSRAKPEILLRYAKGSEATNEKARVFLRIVDILRKYVESSLNSAKSA